MLEQHLLRKGANVTCLTDGGFTSFNNGPNFIFKKETLFAAVREEASNQSLFKNYFDMLDELLLRMVYRSNQAKYITVTNLGCHYN